MISDVYVGFSICWLFPPSTVLACWAILERVFVGFCPFVLNVWWSGDLPRVVPSAGPISAAIGSGSLMIFCRMRLLYCMVRWMEPQLPHPPHWENNCIIFCSRNFFFFSLFNFGSLHAPNLLFSSFCVKKKNKTLKAWSYLKSYVKKCSSSSS